MLVVFDRTSRLKPRVLGAKRIIDVLGSVFGLAIFSVPMAIVAVIVRVGLGSPVLFRHERPGRDGQLFSLVKFRTMSDRRDAGGDLLPDEQRLTMLGRLLRRTSVDELPTLWNVLRGHMSLVGPRPLLPRYTEYFTPTEATRLDVRPGITGWAQINGRNTTGWNRRLALDAWYVEHLSLVLDLRILLITLAQVVRSDGVVTDPESLMRNLDDERRDPRETKDAS